MYFTGMNLSPKIKSNKKNVDVKKSHHAMTVDF